MTRGSIRQVPIIPDHEVLRMIGGGSYGEVWLASSVTGAMRAVKIVRREDFDDDRTFEREFEGILKYEPLSRDHPGLVHILHIGRSGDRHENAFYYYVMELGDDIHSGRNINPVEYEARNLLIDMKHSGGKPLDPDEVITIGLSVSDAISFLHEKGLAHRDIKPSNIIFVDGKAKLADIGLVAARGQGTFVGTEGFVPPEGPGTAQADVYALGKVLYEMATGKDRLDFPELPDEMPEIGHRKRWLGLNQLICDVCEHRVSQRTVKTAAGLADGLRRLEAGRRLKRRRDSLLVKLVPSIFVIGLVTWLFGGQIGSFVKNKWSDGKSDISPVNQLLKPQYGFVKVLSDPSGAAVYDADGVFLNVTPMKNIKLEAGSQYEFEFRLDGYRTGRKRGIVKADEMKIVEHQLVVYSPPVEGQEWVDNAGFLYEPKDDYHVSVNFINNYRWRRYLASINSGSKLNKNTLKWKGEGSQMALVSENDAHEYAKSLSKAARSKGYLNDEQSIYAEVHKDLDTSGIDKHAKKKQLYPFKAVVKKIPFAKLEIHSTPSNADVYINDQLFGRTPIYLKRIKPGNLEITLFYEGYRKVTKNLVIEELAVEKFDFELKRNNSVVFGEEWENSLGMKFVPINGQADLLVSIWETRWKDYNSIISENRMARVLKINQLTEDHPMLEVSRNDAEKFCDLLTIQERKEERIPKDARYRLPTDREWSYFSGVDDDPDKLPAQREFNGEEVFPWGKVWLTQRAGGIIANLAGEELKSETPVHYIEGYLDEYVMSSPVGMFEPNALGLYDLSGNVHEWVADNYIASDDYGVLRGGSYATYLKDHLYVSHRNVVNPSKRRDTFGFRVVLEKSIESK